MQWQYVVVDEANGFEKDYERHRISRLLEIPHIPVKPQIEQPDINQEAEQASDREVVTSQTPRLSRRGHGRVDGLEHLSKSITVHDYLSTGTDLAPL
jgi:hypothetical protein